mmetsp:Transcript_20975/g.41884  ORF Transcript_20975/g.41884 Transcript_20975/m.41884 type:complete len:253 (+) Transcript_20975:427-1185(+)
MHGLSSEGNWGSIRHTRPCIKGRSKLGLLTHALSSPVRRAPHRTVTIDRLMKQKVERSLFKHSRDVLNRLQKLCRETPVRGVPGAGPLHPRIFYQPVQLLHSRVGSQQHTQLLEPLGCQKPPPLKPHSLIFREVLHNCADLRHVVRVPCVVSRGPHLHASIRGCVDFIDSPEDGRKAAREEDSLEGLWEEGEVGKVTETPETLAQQGPFVFWKQKLPNCLCVPHNVVSSEVAQVFCDCFRTAKSFEHIQRRW